MTPDQQELHDKLITKLFELFNVEAIGMNLDTATRAVENFAAYTLYHMHKETNSLDLLSAAKEGVMIHDLIREYMGANDEAKAEKQIAT